MRSPEPAAPSDRAVARRCLPLCVALLLVYGGHTALWSYQERMGREVGLSAETVGVVLAVSALAAMLGSFVSWKAALRFGYLRSQLISIVFLTLFALALTLRGQVALFVVAVTAIKVAWFFGLPYFKGAIARIDRSGRWLTLSGAFMAIGSALGPAVGAIGATYGLSLIGYIAAAIYLASMVLWLPTLHSLDRADQANAKRNGLPA